jgi:hypothetical protein
MQRCRWPAAALPARSLPQATPADSPPGRHAAHRHLLELLQRAYLLRHLLPQPDLLLVHHAQQVVLEVGALLGHQRVHAVQRDAPAEGACVWGWG